MPQYNSICLNCYKILKKNMDLPKYTWVRIGESLISIWSSFQLIPLNYAKRTPMKNAQQNGRRNIKTNINWYQEKMLISKTRQLQKIPKIIWYFTLTVK